MAFIGQAGALFRKMKHRTNRGAKRRRIAAGSPPGSHGMRRADPRAPWAHPLVPAGNDRGACERAIARARHGGKGLRGRPEDPYQIRIRYIMEPKNTRVDQSLAQEYSHKRDVLGAE